MKLEFGDYCIRPFRDDDAESLALHANNEKIGKNLRDGFPYPYTINDAVGWIDSTKKQPLGASVAVCHGESCIGSMGIILGENVHSQTAELGYWLGEAYWGKGIMSKAIELYSDYVISEFNLLRVFAEPFDDNLASCRALEKAGFSCEGTLRSNAVKNGAVIDMFMYAKLSANQSVESTPSSAARHSY